MNKEKLIEALEIALAELRKPTITFTPPKREPLSESKISAIWDDSDNTDVAITRAIEKAHGIGG